jgi:putative membrane protein
MKTKIVIIVILTILLIVFVLQNTAVVGVKLWFWELNIQEALLLFVCFAIGLIIGLIIPASRHKEKADNPPDAG